MENNIQEYIDILISLEPAFKKAGELAVKMQKTAKSNNKFSTGFAGIDIVTEADLAVQEVILAEMAKTKLIDCKLIAEEDTPLAKKFTGKNGLTLTLDPIDGTLLYAAGKNLYLTIISLHNGKNLFYTFLHYPFFNWTRRITSKIEDFGIMPEIKIKPGINLEKTIGYTVKPPKIIDKEIFKKLVNEGYSFCKASDITDEAGSTTLFIMDKIGGYYLEISNPYDGLVGLHYGGTKNFEIYSTIDFSTLSPTDHGPHYSGWYVILKK